ncbi:MAG: hypothetical protein AB7E95_14605 [Kiritimatiellales bacterium]
MKRIISLSIIFLISVFNAAAIPMVPAKQVSTDTSGFTVSTGATVQVVLDEIDARTGNATTGTVGVVELATSDDIATGTNTTKAITPYELSQALSDPDWVTFATNGFFRLPDGYIFQFGYSNVSGATLSFPTNFPNACLNFSLTEIGYATNGSEKHSIGAASTSGITISGGSGYYYWRAIGY